MVDKEVFSYWVTQPGQLGQADLPGLEAVIKQFPFCQLAHILAAKAVSAAQPALASQYIPRAAVYALNRQALRSLLEDDLEWSASLLSRLTGSNVPRRLQTGSPQTGSPQTGSPQTGSPQTGSPQTGSPPAESIRTGAEGVGTGAGEKEHAGAADQKEPGPAPAQPGERPPVPEAHVPLDPTAVAEFAIEQELMQVNLKGPDAGNLTKESAQELIARFIRADPAIGQMKQDPVPAGSHEDLSQRNMLHLEDFATESFAEILLRQGKIERAIGIYEKLMLKIPEKKGYFAEKINSLKY